MLGQLGKVEPSSKSGSLAAEEEEPSHWQLRAQPPAAPAAADIQAPSELFSFTKANMSRILRQMLQ